MLDGIRGWEWIIIAVLVVGVFGLPKLPNAARSIGKSLRILRDEVKGVSTDGDGKGGANGSVVDGSVVDGSAVDGRAGDGTAGDGKARGKARGKA
jgi:sec-independent protein translocase protein TatA